MGLFDKNKNKNLEEGHNNNLFSDDDDYITPLQHRMITGERRVAAPHAITADELTGKAESIPMHPSGERTSNSVYESMREHQKPTETAVGDDYVPSWADFSEKSRPQMTAEETAEAAKRAEEILKTTNVRTEALSEEEKRPLFEGVEPKTVRKPEVRSEPTVFIQEPIAAEEPESESAAAFLARCKMAVMGTESEGDASPETVPMFKSEPEKAKTEAPRDEDFEAFVRRIKNETEQVTTAGSVQEKLPETEAKEPAEEILEPKAEKTVEEAEEPTKATEETAREVKVEVEVIPENAPTEIMHTAPVPPIAPAVATTTVIPVLPTAPQGDVKIYGKVVKGKVIQQTPDGDVEVAEIIKAQKAAEETRIIGELQATRMFDGLDDAIAQKAEDSFVGSRDIYEEEEEEPTQTSYYEEEDPDLEVIEDYNDLNDAARLRTSMQAEKTAQTVKTAISFGTFVLMLLLSLPVMDLMPVMAGGIISLVLLVVTLAANFDIFVEFKNIGKRFTFDCPVAIAAVVALVQTAVSTFGYDGKYAFLAAYAALLLGVNRYVKLAKHLRISKGLEIIANSEEKTALCLTDETTSKVIASGAVEGEVIGVVAQKAVNIQGFIKNSNYKSPFDLKVRILTLVGVIVAVVTGVCTGVIVDFGAGITMLSAMLCCVFPASAVLSAEMPMNRIASRLAEKGAALAGFKGAYDIDQANTVSVKTADLFPEGTVKLYNMKTLSKNELGQTLTAAAAVAYAAESPLVGIFRDMVGVSSGAELPKVNGVQYEDKMGISGWIGDNTVLIGNRNLMQGHNVAVPPATVDQKILKAGYFPVYIACKGIPCLLFIVKYEVDPTIRAELLKLCNTGMTVLVNPQDPNASDTMICDYFGVPSDALKCMNHNGRVMYERRTKAKESVTAPAVGGKDITGTFAAVTASIKLNTIIAMLTAAYIVAAVLGGILLIYLAVLGKLSLVTSFALTVFQAIFMLISVIAMKVKDR